MGIWVAWGILLVAIAIIGLFTWAALAVSSQISRREEQRDNHH